MKAIRFEFDLETKNTSITLKIPNWFPIIFGHYEEIFVGRENDDKTWRWTNGKGKPVKNIQLIAVLGYARKQYWDECFNQ